MDAPGFAAMLALGFDLFVQEEETITKKTPDKSNSKEAFSELRAKPCLCSSPCPCTAPALVLGGRAQPAGLAGHRSPQAARSRGRQLTDPPVRSVYLP